MKYSVIGIITILLGFAIADSLGVFNDKPYTKVRHGNHYHYVPDDRNPEVPLHRFPTVKPAPGEKITPNGLIVPAGN